MNKKTIALTLLGLASAFALTTDVKAVETTADVEFTAGQLTIEPKNSIVFTNYELTGQNEEINTSASEDFKLTVTDATGSRGGWNVQARHSGFYQGEEKLVGATIKLSEGTLSNPLSVEGVSLAQEISIDEDATFISSAIQDRGMGIFEHAWTSSNLKLSIPGNTAQNMLKGSYSTVIDWTLEAGPQAEITSAQ